MAILRSAEIRDMSEEEVDEKIFELKGELLREKTKIASGGVADNPGRIKEIRRTIARILTIKRENEGVKK
ncbi:MAG: 50S ribosomal protein L29 [Candidatus Hydrothermarchaeaceae archaeon]